MTLTYIEEKLSIDVPFRVECGQVHLDPVMVLDFGLQLLHRELLQLRHAHYLHVGVLECLIERINNSNKGERSRER